MSTMRNIVLGSAALLGMGGVYIGDKYVDEGRNTISHPSEKSTKGPKDVPALMKILVDAGKTLDASDKNEDEKIWTLVFEKLADQLGRGDAIGLSSLLGNSVKSDVEGLINGQKRKTQYNVNVDRNIVKGNNNFSIAFDSEQRGLSGKKIQGNLLFWFDGGEIHHNDGTGERIISGTDMLKILERMAS